MAVVTKPARDVEVGELLWDGMAMGLEIVEIATTDQIEIDGKAGDWLHFQVRPPAGVRSWRPACRVFYQPDEQVEILEN